MPFLKELFAFFGEGAHYPQEFKCISFKVRKENPQRTFFAVFARLSLRSLRETLIKNFKICRDQKCFVVI